MTRVYRIQVVKCCDLGDRKIFVKYYFYDLILRYKTSNKSLHIFCMFFFQISACKKGYSPTNVCNSSQETISKNTVLSDKDLIRFDFSKIVNIQTKHSMKTSRLHLCVQSI